MSELPPADSSKQFLVAHGEISSIDKGVLARLLGKFGLVTEFLTKAEFEARQQIIVVDVNATKLTETEATQQYRFTQLTSRNDYLVREHISNFAELRPDIGMRRLGSLFTYLVDGKRETYGRLPRYDKNTEPVPLPGLKIVRRSEVGIPECGNTGTYQSDRLDMSQLYAIEVGSIIDYPDSTDAATIKGHLVRKDLIRQLAYQLTSQLTEQTTQSTTLEQS